MDWISEESESISKTSFLVKERVFDGKSKTCASVIIVDSVSFGKMLFLDHELQSAEIDEHIYHESLVHPVMACASAKATGKLRVLVVGGGEGATVREVLKWEPESVDWVDIDGDLVKLCEEKLRWAPGVLQNSIVRYQAVDIRVAFQEHKLYDVIIIDLPDPDGDTGYLYSPEFWKDTRAHLAENGHLATHCGEVHPFGNVGNGFERIKNSDMSFNLMGFYPQSMPSFQSEWGFFMWAGKDQNPFAFIGGGPQTVRMPPGLRVVDWDQMHAWAALNLLWRSALGRPRLHQLTATLV